MATITIKNLIGGSINIVTGGGGTSERWVNPQYTDDWVFSDGQEHTIRIDYTDETFDGHLAYSYYMDNYLVKGDTDAYEIEISDNNNNVTAYRKYIPGHWEDADGNWINGSWGDWNSVISGYEVEDGEPYGNPNVWYLISDGQPSAELKKSSNLALWYGAFSEKSNIPFATRTWNNTKPAPTT